MKFVRLGYLSYVVTLALAHMFITLSPWTAPAFASGMSGTVAVAGFVALFGAWVLAAAADVALGLERVLPLSFAGESIFSIIGLAILLIVGAASLPFYFVCAVTGPVLVLVKAFEQFAGIHTELNPV